MKLLQNMIYVLLLCSSFAAFSVVAGKSGDGQREKTDISRVKIKVFRGPNQEEMGKKFASWGFWVKQPSVLKVKSHQVKDLNSQNHGALVLEVEFHQVADLERRNYGAPVLEPELHQEADPERRIQEVRERGTRNLRNAILIRPLYREVVSRLRNFRRRRLL